MKINKLFYLIFSFFLLYPAISNSQQIKNEVQLARKPCMIWITDSQVVDGNKIEYIDADTMHNVIYLHLTSKQIVLKLNNIGKKEATKKILEQIEKCS